MDKQPAQSEQAEKGGQLTLPTLPDPRLQKEYDFSKQRPVTSPQTRIALKALRDHPNGITTTTLQREPYNICHPPARIMDLREAGYNVVTIQDRYHVGRYVLLGSKAAPE